MLSGLLPFICGVTITLTLLVTFLNIEHTTLASSVATESDTKLIYLPMAFNPPMPPLAGAAIGYTGAWNKVSIGSNVFFPSFWKNDSDWHSTVAIQNTSDQLATLILSFFHQDGTIAHTTENILLLPYGTYIASASEFTSLPNGFYAVAATASENIVGMVNTLDATGKMATAYNGANQGSLNIAIPWLTKVNVGYTSRLCIQNTTAMPTNVTIQFHNINSGNSSTLSLILSADGFNCIEPPDEPSAPSGFRGTASIIANNDIVVTVEEVRSTEGWAQGYLGEDLYTNAMLNYIPLCKKTNGWQTNILFANVGTQATDIHLSYRNMDGTLLFERIITGNASNYGSTTCHNDFPIISPPLPPDDYLGSAIVAAAQSEIITLIYESNMLNNTDVFSYRGLADAASTVYVPNVGFGLNLWKSTLSIQNADSITNSVKVFFYDQQGFATEELLDEVPPYGMKQYEIDQIPGLPGSFEGSAIISGTHPIAVFISKER